MSFDLLTATSCLAKRAQRTARPHVELKVESIVAVCAGGTAGGPRCWHMPIDPKACDTYIIKTEAEH